MRLVKSLISAIQNRETEPVKKKTQTTAQVKAQPTNGAKHFCPQCGTELVPAGGDMKGYYFCMNCKQLATTKP